MIECLRIGLDGKTVMLREKLLHQKKRPNPSSAGENVPRPGPLAATASGKGCGGSATEQGPGRKRRERKEQLFQLFFVQGNRQQPTHAIASWPENYRQST